MIAGAHGFVGSRAMEHYPAATPVPSELLRGADNRLIDFVQAHHPNIIINAAAVSDIRTCEQYPEASYSANVKLPTVLAKAARSCKARLISFSSDQVYTGCEDKGPYREEAILPAPRNLYARHKLEAEQRVLDIAPDSILLRATWMYDMPMYLGRNSANASHANRGNFLVNVLSAVLHGTEIAFSSRQYRGITYVRQVVDFLDQVPGLPGGIYNYGSENHLNMLQTAGALLKELGLEGRLQDTAEDRHNLWMDCSRLRSHGIHFDSTVQGLKQCMEDYGLRQ